MSGPTFSEEALRDLDPAKIAQKIADREADVTVQQAVVDRLDSLLDAEQRDLLSLERGLDDLRNVQSQIAALR